MCVGSRARVWGVLACVWVGVCVRARARGGVRVCMRVCVGVGVCVCVCGQRFYHDWYKHCLHIFFLCHSKVVLESSPV